MFSPISDAHLIQLWKNLFAAKLVPDDGQLLAYCLLDVFNFHSIEIRWFKFFIKNANRNRVKTYFLSLNMGHCIVVQRPSQQK